MDGPPPEFATAAGVATFTPCGDRRWRVALDGTHVAELVEAECDPETEQVAWGLTTRDGRSSPWRATWMDALTDLPSSESDAPA